VWLVAAGRWCGHDPKRVKGDGPTAPSSRPRSLQFTPHGRGRGGMVPGPMAGQDPLEGEVEQPFHRTGLFLPREPAGVSKRNKMAAAPGPGQVIASEEEFLPIEEDGVPRRVAGGRDRD